MDRWHLLTPSNPHIIASHPRVVDWSRPSGSHMFYRLGTFAVRFRWPIIAFWAALFLISLPLAPQVVSKLKGGFGEADTESQRALDLLVEELGATESTFTLVFTSTAITIDDDRYVAEMRRTLEPILRMPEVKEVTTFYNSVSARLVSQDRTTTFAIVELDLELDEGLDLYPSLKETLKLDQGQEGELQVLATGVIPIFSDLNEASERDLRRAELISFPLVLVALVVVFGGLVAAGLPVAMGAVSVAMALASLFLLGQVTDISIFALNIVSFLGLGVAIDYSLLVVSRFREELQESETDEAVARTTATAGRALFFSAVTSMLGLSGLLFFKFMMLRSIGIGGMLVILISLLVAITLLPALLSLLGPKVDRLSLLPRRLHSRNRRYWRRLASWVMAHPFLVSIPLVIFLILLGAPFLGVNLGAPWASILPSDAESRQGQELLTDKMGPGALSPILVLAHSASPILDPDNVGYLYDYLLPFREDPRVDRVESLVTIHPSLDKDFYQRLYSNPQSLTTQHEALVKELASDNTTVIRVFSHFSPNSAETKELVKEMRAAGGQGDLELSLTGVTASQEDAISVMYRDFPRAVVYVMVTIYVALFFLFRSVVLPLKAIAMNAVSIFASYGAVVLIFQQGYLQGLLGFQSEGFVQATVPILLFSIIFGLSMDYEVFLLSRVKEIYDKTGDNTSSVAQGLEATGRVITSAALILVLVAAAFSTSDIIIVKALGLGTAIAIFLDATVVRALLVPALMRIMGDWNWWSPSLLTRLLPGWRSPP